jgi:hypothetical protein
MTPGKPCQHCTVRAALFMKTGLKTFKCAWLREEGQMPDEFRPDLCGAIVVLNGKWNGWTVMHAAPTGEEIPTATLDWIKAYALKKGIPLMFQENHVKNDEFAEMKILGYGPPDFVHAVQNAIGPGDVLKL